MLRLVSLSIVIFLSCCFSKGLSTVNNCKERCSSCLCYCELENSLLATEDNADQLTRAFFPPEGNSPEFVTITYNFNSTTDPQTWYWSAQTSHFLHPFEIFQFLSLLFSKPEPYYTGVMTIDLKVECTDLTSDESFNTLQLFTQRLKLYAERANLGSPNLILRDTYFAKAYNKKTLNDVLTRDSDRIITIIICAAIFIILFSVIIMVTIVITFFCSKSYQKSKWIQNVKEKKPTVLSLAMLSGIANLYIISLAFSALGYWYDPKGKIDIFHSSNTRINAAPLYTALFIDLIAFLVWLFFVVFAGVVHCTMPNNIQICRSWLTFRYTIKCKECVGVEHMRSISLFSDIAFNILSLTVLCPIFCIIAHSPYIAIAYLNDGDHASSIFIYYTVMSFIIFGVTRLFFHWCQHFIKDKDVVDTAEMDKNDHILCCCTLRKKEGGETTKATVDEKSACFITTVIIFLFVALLFLLGLIVVISCYFVIIPINKSISDAPNRVLSIYQSGGFLIGSFIIYKVFTHFHTKEKDKDIGKNVQDIHVILQKWLSHPTQQLYGLKQQVDQLKQKIANSPQQQPLLPHQLPSQPSYKVQLEEYKRQFELLQEQIKDSNDYKIDLKEVIDELEQNPNVK